MEILSFFKTSSHVPRKREVGMEKERENERKKAPTVCSAAPTSTSFRYNKISAFLPAFDNSLTCERMTRASSSDGRGALISAFLPDEMMR